MEEYQIKKEKLLDGASFINGFAQAKNLIEKQMKIGKKIKDLKVMRQAKQDVVSKIKEARSKSREMQAVKSVLFDNDFGKKNLSRQQ